MKKKVYRNWSFSLLFSLVSIEYPSLRRIIFYRSIIKILLFERKVLFTRDGGYRRDIILLSIRFENLFSPVVYFQTHTHTQIGRNKRRKEEKKDICRYRRSWWMLTTAGYIQIQKQAVLALVGKEHVQTFQLLVSAQRHLQQSSCVIADVRKVLRANCAERVRQFDTVPRDRWDRWSKT